MKRRILGDITTQIYEAAGGDTEGFLPTGAVAGAKVEPREDPGKTLAEVVLSYLIDGKSGHFYDCIWGKHGHDFGDGCSATCIALRAALAPFRSSDQEK